MSFLLISLLKSGNDPRLANQLRSVLILLSNLVHHVTALLDLLHFCKSDLAQSTLSQHEVDIVFFLCIVEIIMSLDEMAKDTLPALEESTIRRSIPTTNVTAELIPELIPSRDNDTALIKKLHENLLRLFWRRRW